MKRKEIAIALRELAPELAPIYKDHPLAVARVCDDVLDRSGALLGYVRQEALKLCQ